MNLSGLEDLIPPIAQMLGIEPASLLLFLGILIIIARIVSRVIPDDQAGPLGFVRRIASLIAIEVGNRVAPGVTVNDIAKAVVANKITKLKGEVSGESKETLREQIPPQEAS